MVTAALKYLNEVKFLLNNVEDYNIAAFDPVCQT
jgi:hypothetical protein